MSIRRPLTALLSLLLIGACGKDRPVTSEMDAAVDEIVPGCLAPEGANPEGTAELDDGPRGLASVTLDERSACRRSYTLSTTAALRDNQPANPRVISEAESRPTLRSGNDIFDALYALAQVEALQLSVDAIRDAAFNGGAPVDCGTGGCFETGEKWNYVWTRDTAYAVDLGLSVVDPLRARNSLSFKLSERRGGGNLQIVQDTGTGGSYPVSSDRVSWALGAWALLQDLEGEARTGFRDRAYDALRNSIEQDRAIVWDESDGLYYGEQSFLDWREQSYPDWTAAEVVHIAMSKALSTNLLHLRALEITAALAAERADGEAQGRYADWAGALRDSIRTGFWLEAEGQFSTFLTTELDPAKTRRFDLLGSAFAVLFEVATPDQAQRILSGYPHYGPGAPVIWPQQQEVPIYHNRGEWPFVSAYWLRAAAMADHDAVADRMVWALMRGAALNLSNMENFEAGTGAAWVSEGETSGPVVNSQRQLWSVAGYLSMVHHTLFGLHPGPAGLVVSPYITREMRKGIFAGTDALVLNDYPYQGKTITLRLHLPQAGPVGGSYRTARMTLNDREHSGAVQAELLADQNLLELWLEEDTTSAGKFLTEVSDSDWKKVFAPHAPSITSITEDTGALRVSIDLQSNLPDDVRIHIYRDGVLVAADLPGSTTSWIDPNSAANTQASYCYALELSFATGNHSQHSPPQCWWQEADAGMQIVDASTFTNTGGLASNNHGRFHYENWGDAGHQLVATGITPTSTGGHLLQVEYGNGAGNLSTGVTCGVKRLLVTDDEDGSLVGEGALVMPQLGDWSRWGLSNFVPVQLEAGRSYTVTIESNPLYANMSALSHFATYTGGQGGSDGEFNRVNIANLRILQR
jgi:hypothetical protein